jgi:hypothetical protein
VGEDYRTLYFVRRALATTDCHDAPLINQRTDALNCKLRRPPAD